MSDLRIEVAYATPERQYIAQLIVPIGTTLFEAVQHSDITRIFPDLDIEQADFGIWGKVKPKTTRLADGQRIEIYRPLIADPKESRRKRAEKKAAEKSSGF